MSSLEHFFQCPYCWEKISMLLEVSNEEQTYIEDCEVCCQPIQIGFSGDEEGSLTNFNSVSIEQ